MFIDGLKEQLNESITENGALGYATSGKALVDFNFKVASFRNMCDEDIIIDFKNIWYENKELALKYLFFARDIREGLGERRLFKVCIKEVVDELDNRVFEWIKEFGRLDDIFVFDNTKLEDDLYNFIKNQLTQDTINYQNKQPISLLAKWLPSINTSSKHTRELAKKVCSKLGFNYKQYRKMLSTLRAYLKVTEIYCCANEWKQIDYSQVPSCANLKYKEAFLKHDKDRREKYLESLQKGETKINSSVVFPHNIIEKYDISKEDITLEEMWKALPNYVEGETNTIVVRDGSGSMTCTSNGTKPLTIATALSIYFGQRCKGQFKDKFITFSERPKLVDFSNYTSLRDIIRLCNRYAECANTNIEATFHLILKTAIENNLKQEEIPNLLIISDMEFDNATYGNVNKKLFDNISEIFESYGYKLPKLSFWNVASRTNTIPVMQNELGVNLVSGFSPAICKLVLSESTDPYKALVQELTKERYKDITLR